MPIIVKLMKLKRVITSVKRGLLINMQPFVTNFELFEVFLQRKKLFLSYLWPAANC